MTRRFRPDETEREFVSALSAAVAQFDPGDWQAAWPVLAEIGLLGALAPVEAGGAGVGLDTVVLAFEEVGRRCLAGPIVESGVFAMPLLAGVPDYAEAVAQGQTVITAAFAGDEPVPYADHADHLLVHADGGARLLPRAALEVVAVASIDSDEPLYAVSHHGSEAVELGCTWEELRAACDRASLATAAVLVGLCESAIGKTVEYTGQRTQFGRPIGSFQAVQHAVAEAEVQTQLARALVRQAAAAWVTDPVDRLPGPAPSKLTAMARVCATRAAQGAAEVALQAHGAIGYTKEYELGRILRRIWVLAPAWGDLAFQRRRVVGARVD